MNELDEQKNILTKEGEQELRVELKRLVEIERPAVIEEIKEAREQGDLSENAEFDAAREKQGTIEDRIKEIEMILQNSTIVVKAKTSKRVRIGSIVVIIDNKGKEETYQIVGSLEANPLKEYDPEREDKPLFAKISNISPLAIAVLGASEGDVVTVDAVKKYEVKIKEIK